MDFKVFVVIAVVLTLVWGSLLVFWWKKADEITKDPCRICAEYQGSAVTCISGGIIPVSKYYYPNGSVALNAPEVVGELSSINFSNFIVNVSK